MDEDLLEHEQEALVLIVADVASETPLIRCAFDLHVFDTAHVDSLIASWDQETH